MPSRTAAALAPLLAALAAGCGGADARHVAGTVTFQGRPVPAGKIYFTPDGAKGNAGPTGYADIRNGAYDTAAAGGRGAPPGPVVVAIEGTDPAAPAGKPDRAGEVVVKALFPPYETAADLSAGGPTKDFDVPTPPPAPKGGKAPR
jgi:hypothetical protein